MCENVCFAVRGSTGFFLKKGIKPEHVIFEDNENPKTNPCRVFEFSTTGRFFAYCDTIRTCVIEVATGRMILSTELKRTQAIGFSPRDSYFLTWEPYVVYNNAKEGEEKRTPEPNLRIWNMLTGEHMCSVVAPKQVAWKPQFSDDEKTMVRLMGAEVLVHKDNNFEKYDSKFTIPKMEGFSLSPGNQLHIACYMAAHGGQPASVQIRRIDEKFTVVCNKTFFKSDSAKFFWNCKGTAVLILSVVDVDSTNKSYYGEQSVSLVNIITGGASLVPLGKKGPVYASKWNPNGREFAVCYGYMPAKVTIYNMQANAVFDMEEGPRNDIFYNPIGNILLVCGFGNLATGKMEFWDVQKKKIIVTIAVPNTTHFEWAPDGQHFVTCTTTPRLRIDNCYRFWHYSGRLLSEVTYDSPREELWQVALRPLVLDPNTTFTIRELTPAEKSAAGLIVKGGGANGVPAGAVAKQTAYVPPHLRKGDTGKGALAAVPTPLNDKEKKIKNVQRKIEDIQKLKEKQSRGEKLQMNQLAKIASEDQLVAELEALQVA